MTKLAIIIVNYKREDLTINLVEQELSKVSIAHKTIIVNNSATDRSNHTLCKELNAILVSDVNIQLGSDGDVFVVSSLDNLGFARGNNLGVMFAKKMFHPQYILFTNNDIKLIGNRVVDGLIKKMENNSNIGIIGPRVVGMDGKCQSPYPYRSFWNRHVWIYWSSFFYTSKKKIEKFGLDYPEKAKEGFHYYVMGSFFMVRADDLYRCGMFDPNTFLYAEEVILSERMAAIGKGVYYAPFVEVIHEHGATTSKYARNKVNDWQFNSECYYYKTYKNVCIAEIWVARLTRFLLKVIGKA